MSGGTTTPVHKSEKEGVDLQLHSPAIECNFKATISIDSGLLAYLLQTDQRPHSGASEA